MDKNSLEQEILKMVSFIVERDEDELLKNRNKHFFNDLGLDSLVALEIIAAIEKKYRIEIPEEKISDITSLDQVIELVNELVAVAS